MITLTILYFLSENQSPKRSNGVREPLCPAWQGLWASVAFAPLLVIDDNASIRELLRFVLEEEGYEVIESADGAEGLQRYQAEPTDLVITDLTMPGMDGLELLEALQRVVPTPALMAISGDRDALTQARKLTPVYVCEAVSAGASPDSRAQPESAALKL